MDEGTTYARVRGLLSGLADGCADTSVAIGYDRVLVELDDRCPQLPDPAAADVVVDRAAAVAEVRRLLPLLAESGFGRFGLVLCRGLLEDAWTAERQGAR